MARRGIMLPTNQHYITISTNSTMQIFRQIVPMAFFLIAILGLMAANTQQNSNRIAVSNGKMRATKEIQERLPDPVKCKVLKFTLYHLSRSNDVKKIINEGSKFNAEVRAAIASSRVGDEFQFTEIRTVCEGDAAGRPVPSFTYVVK